MRGRESIVPELDCLDGVNTTIIKLDRKRTGSNPMNLEKLRARSARAFIIACIAVGAVKPGWVLADSGPGRQRTIDVSYTEYTWRLLQWQDSSLACELKIEHPEEPTDAEIYFQCGETIYYQWLESMPCYDSGGEDAQECSGIYLLQIRSEERTKEIVIDLPAPTVRVDLNDCVPVQGTDLCAGRPSLLITAEEPLPNEEITQVEGRINEIPFFCSGEACEVPLQATNERGAALEFWAESSYGDSSAHYSGLIRVTESASDSPFTTGWRVEIISGLIDLNNVEGCAEIWQTFPPLGTPPEWLSSPSHPNVLQTSEPYTYLAGQMIQEGYVDTSHCDDWGLSEDGYASQCGLEASLALVYLWQNTFDKLILQSSLQAGIPSSLLKRIVARESQFWPETTQELYREYGFGHMTELGADTTLLWNRDFYEQFCPLVLEVGRCQLGYAALDDWSQATLRGALLSEMEIFLPDNVYDIDLERVEESLSLFSETLLGNCTQVGQMISYETDQIAGEISSYGDLWRFTLANYHGGPGCLSDAIIDVHKQKKALTWENISTSLEDSCPWVLAYVDDITE